MAGQRHRLTGSLPVHTPREFISHRLALRQQTVRGGFDSRGVVRAVHERHVFGDVVGGHHALVLAQAVLSTAWDLFRTAASATRSTTPGKKPAVWRARAM